MPALPVGCAGATDGAVAFAGEGRAGAIDGAVAFAGEGRPLAGEGLPLDGDGAPFLAEPLPSADPPPVGGTFGGLFDVVAALS